MFNFFYISRSVAKGVAKNCVCIFTLAAFQLFCLNLAWCVYFQIKDSLEMQLVLLLFGFTNFQGSSVLVGVVCDCIIHELRGAGTMKQHTMKAPEWRFELLKL